MASEPEETAERILKLADGELAKVPEPQQEETLRHVMREMTTWLEAMKAGKQREQGSRSR